MKLKIVYLLLLCFLLSGCGYYRSITGTVIDAETLQPIEGAVGMVEWTGHGGMPGLAHTVSYKVVEVVTDKNGNAHIEGLINPRVSEVDVAVYKPGYVTWSSRDIFPSYKKREDFSWGNYTFKLERFKPEYSYAEHESFFGSDINSTINVNSKKLINDAFDEAEREKRIEERHNRRRSGDKK